jgi:hypothetical protein
MLLIFIISTLLLTLFLGLFFYFRLRRANNNSLVEEEILLVHYKTLIDLILAENMGARLVPAKVNSIRIHAKGPQGSNSLSLTKVQGKMIVVWTWISAEFGERGKEWSFAYDHDQASMYREIKHSCDAYKASLFQKYNLNLLVKR